MDAAPLLRRVAVGLHDCRLEAVLIGNAAAALQGAPVTTLDFDFLFRPTPGNVRKLKALADRLAATILRPYYPASSLYRVVNEDLGLQLDFMGAIHGVRSFASLRSRAARLELDGATLLVAALEDIIRSKRAAGGASERPAGPATRPCCPSWRPPVPKRKPAGSRARRLAALKKESAAVLRARIRRLLERPMAERTHFLRVRLPGGGSAL
jgi:hypothetical protein